MGIAKKPWILLPLLAALALPAAAGVEYRARSWQEGEQKNKQAESNVHASIEGDKAKILFEDSGNEMMPAGSYLLTTDGGQTIHLVKPEDKTYGEFDLEAIFQMMGALSESGMMKFEIDNARVESLPSGSGKTVAGVATEHARFRTNYDMTIKVMGMGRAQHVETLQELWYSEALSDAAMGIWLRKEPPKTNTELDELIALEVGKIRGMPLEAITRTTTTGKKGKQTTTVNHTLVSDLRQGVSFPAATFVIPDDYRLVQMMPTTGMMAGGQPAEQSEGGEQESEEEEGGLLGRFKKFGKKNGG